MGCSCHEADWLSRFAEMERRLSAAQGALASADRALFAERGRVVDLEKRLSASESARREAETRAGGFERQRNELRAIKAELDILLASERAARERAERERDEAVAGVARITGREVCSGCFFGPAGHVHTTDEDDVPMWRERAESAESRLAAAEKDRDREIEARRAAERATENHAAFALRTVEAEQKLAAAEAALREMAYLVTDEDGIVNVRSACGCMNPDPGALPATRSYLAGGRS